MAKQDITPQPAKMSKFADLFCWIWATILITIILINGLGYLINGYLMGFIGLVSFICAVIAAGIAAELWWGLNVEKVRRYL